jgi:hypothetical protein
MTACARAAPVTFHLHSSFYCGNSLAGVSISASIPAASLRLPRITAFQNTEEFIALPKHLASDGAISM